MHLFQKTDTGRRHLAFQPGQHLGHGGLVKHAFLLQMDGTAGIGQQLADGGRGTVAAGQFLIVVAGYHAFDGISLDAAFFLVERLNVLNAQNVIGLFQNHIQGIIL